MIEAYLPRPDELWFRRKMLADEATMAYNRAYGGTVDFPEERLSLIHISEPTRH